MARPKLPPDERRSAPLKVLLNEAERATLDAAAAPAPTSTWAREVLLDAAKPKKRTPKPAK